MLTLLRIILRTMIRPFGGINEEAIHVSSQKSVAEKPML